MPVPNISFQEKAVGNGSKSRKGSLIQAWLC
jgi:hypothetical protein